MKMKIIFLCVYFLGAYVCGPDNLPAQESLLIKTVNARSGAINSVAFSPDGKLIASGGLDNTVKIWRFEDNSLVATFEGHKNFVNSVAFSPDGKYLASASSDNTVKIWKIEDGSCVKTLKGHANYVWSAVFSPDGKQIVSGSDDGAVKIWRADSKTRPQTLKGYSSYIYSVAFSPDGKLVASGGAGNTIKIWNVKSGLCVRTLEGHNNYVNSAVFSPAGVYLASGSDDGAVKIWRIEDGLCVKTFAEHAKPVAAVSYSPDGAYVVSGSNDGTIKVWAVSQGASVRTLEGHRQFVKTVAVSPDGKYVVSGSFDKTMKIWLTPWEAERRDKEIENYSVHYNEGLRLLSSPATANLEKSVAEFKQALSYKRTEECEKKLNEAAAALDKKKEQTGKMIKTILTILVIVSALALLYLAVYGVKKKKRLRETLPGEMKRETLSGNYENAFKLYVQYKSIGGNMQNLPQEEMLELYRGRQALDELPKEDLPCRFLLAYAANFAKEGNYRVALSMLRSGKLADEFKNPEEYDAFAGIYEKARRPETLLTLKFAPDVYTGLAEAFFKIKDYGSCEKICSFKKQFYAEKVSPRDKELAAACQKERPPSDPEPSL